MVCLHRGEGKGDNSGGKRAKTITHDRVWDYAMRLKQREAVKKRPLISSR